MIVLVINCGSSSLKFQLMNMTDETILAKGICERIGIEKSQMVYKNEIKGIKETVEKDMPDHRVASEIMLNILKDAEIGVIKDISEIDAIGHRVVQGGEYFSDSVLVDEDVIKKIEELQELAPLHNPANLIGIKMAQELLKGKPNVVTFDTAFHQTMPPYAFMYGLPYEDYTELKVRKYGMHGTSHKYVSEKVAEYLGKKDSKIIVAHLGNGASISAVQNGKSIDTSMGLTPLQGLLMGTRCGDIDPAAVTFIMSERGLSPSEMDSRMNKESGLLALSGQSSDFRDVQEGMNKGNERAKLAFDVFVHRIRSYIGAYASAMNGVDAIAFTGGIGENAVAVRESICKNLEYLGVDFDKEKNVIKDGDFEITKENSKVKVFKVETAEELVIARDTYKLVKQ